MAGFSNGIPPLSLEIQAGLLMPLHATCEGWFYQKEAGPLPQFHAL
jgi:hypothetical protein